MRQYRGERKRGRLLAQSITMLPVYRTDNQQTQFLLPLKTKQVGITQSASFPMILRPGSIAAPTTPLSSHRSCLCVCALVNIPLDFDAICVTHAAPGGDLATGGCFWRFAINLDDYRGDGEWCLDGGFGNNCLCGLVRGRECCTYYIVDSTSGKSVVPLPTFSRKNNNFSRVNEHSIKTSTFGIKSFEAKTLITSIFAFLSSSMFPVLGTIVFGVYGLVKECCTFTS